MNSTGVIFEFDMINLEGYLEPLIVSKLSLANWEFPCDE